MKLLIIDDEQTAIRDLSMVLNDIDKTCEIDSASSADQALSLCRSNDYDVIFLDINMPGKSGLTIAKDIKSVSPDANIVMVTAYPQYALDALRLYVSGYILKPAEESEVREALLHLRNPLSSKRSGLFVRCFGDFEVFYDAEPVKFRRSKTKEMFAYLIDRRGSSVTGSQIRAVLWEDDQDDRDRLSNYFSQLTYDMKSTMDEIGCGDVLDISRNAYAVITERIPCDLFRALKSDNDYLSHYTGEYMSQYSWAEYRI